MKIGDFDIDENVLAEALKRTGKRVIETSDYEGKASAANDLTKLRSLLGDDRPVEELATAVKKLKDLELSQKTKEELLAIKVKDLEKQIEARDKVNQQIQRDLKVRAIKDTFKSMMDKENVKVIEPIMEKYRAKFYDLDVTKMTEAEFTSQAEEAVRQAHAEQQTELSNLGIKVESPQALSFSDGGKVRDGGTPTGGGEIFELLKQTSQTGLNLTLQAPPRK